MLTLFYASATLLQSWRIKCACNKLKEQLALQSSVAFYALPAATRDGFDPTLATSELCINRNSATVTEILWLHGRQRGCCVRPLQLIHITPWISFSESPSLLPFAYSATPDNVLMHQAAGDQLRLRLLLETEAQPDNETHSGNFVRLEEYGKLIAWRIDSHLAVLIDTNIEYFTKLLIATYLQNNLHINDQLRLLRIQSIKAEGEPQPLHLVASHLRKPTRNAINLKPNEWQKHLEGLRSLCVLASQATEFQYKQNLTEGKTGVVKPDLIPSEKKKKLEQQMAAAAAKAQQKETNITTTTTTTTPKTTTITNVTTATTTESANQKIASKTTDVRKLEEAPTVIDGTRFTTTKVAESPARKSSSPSKLSELEKLAAVTAQQVRQKSPAKTASTTASPKISAMTAAYSSTSIMTPTREIEIKKTEINVNESQANVEKPQLEIKPPTEAFVIQSTTATNSNTENLNTSKNVKSAQSIANNTPVSVIDDNAKRSNLQRSKENLTQAKPLNILVYCDSSSVRESVMVTLKDIIPADTYTIYSLTKQQVMLKNWFDSTALLIVCGSIAATPTAEILVDYFLLGGKVLSICSDMLNFILPNYRTAEVREHELVQFSYDKWQKVKMMHHIFCYQPSPVKKNFSTDSDDSGQTALAKRQSALLCPRSIELKDLRGDSHNLDVKVLGTEETWQTPSLLLAISPKSAGRAVFSQVHLETSPTQFETDETKYAILKQNDKIRLEILSDLLSKYLHMQTITNTPAAAKGIVYKNAYFLGLHEDKFHLLEKLNAQCGGNIIKTANLTIQFCGSTDKPIKAESNVLPILIHSCPEDFSTVDYFDNLNTKYIGRLVIYAPIISSSMDIVEHLELSNGIAVIPRQQINGTGRSNNQWLSPIGCAMSSLQLQLEIDSPLGQRLSIIQHLVGAAMVNALKQHEDYKKLDLGIKWPNDVYANGNTKIGGLLVKTVINGGTVLVNLGFGYNLDNRKPTCCLNDLINDYNHTQSIKMPSLSYEKLLALVFNEIERLIEQVQTESTGFNDFYDLYLKLWLHSDQKVKICSVDGKEQEAIVVGIDDDGFLRVRLISGALETVRPDGNSFDMLKGLIVPKFN